MTCREWLLANGYVDVAAVIDQVLVIIEAKRGKTRRNWWDDLAGKPGGDPRFREGIELPVLRVAQIRQGVPVTPHAICRNENEQPPDVRKTARWKAKKKVPAKVRAVAMLPAGSGRDHKKVS